MSERVMQLNSDGTYPHSAWPGLYPIYYVTDDSQPMCADCANANKHLDTGEHDGWHIVGQDVNYEDAEMICCNCNKRIPSAYAEDEAEDCERNVEQIMEWLDYYADLAREYKQNLYEATITDRDGEEHSYNFKAINPWVVSHHISETMLSEGAFYGHKRADTIKLEISELVPEAETMRQGALWLVAL